MALREGHSKCSQRSCEVGQHLLSTKWYIKANEANYKHGFMSYKWMLYNINLKLSYCIGFLVICQGVVEISV